MAIFSLTASGARKSSAANSRDWLQLRGYLKTQPDGSVTVSTKPPQQSRTAEALAKIRQREGRDRGRDDGPSR